nr:hypothetical protein CFP56_39892 [Quercus suber]
MINARTFEERRKHNRIANLSRRWRSVDNGLLLSSSFTVSNKPSSYIVLSNTRMFASMNLCFLLEMCETKPVEVMLKIEAPELHPSFIGRKQRLSKISVINVVAWELFSFMATEIYTYNASCEISV